ncbi:hypothetical protein [Halarchaeum sp. P4]|uniref:hypothetical protein n=1 Tax=Halarchaeum sp. P4 TaxID=3421639 RepID=UPI003EB91A83
MRLLTRLWEVVDGRGDDSFRECRRCGTTLEADGEVCPACGSDDVAFIDLG